MKLSELNSLIETIIIKVLKEAWEGNPKINSTGEYADKTIGELESMRDTLKAKEDRTEAETTKLRQINFAIRAKRGFKGGVE